MLHQSQTSTFYYHKCIYFICNWIRKNIYSVIQNNTTLCFIYFCCSFCTFNTGYFKTFTQVLFLWVTFTFTRVIILTQYLHQQCVWHWRQPAGWDTVFHPATVTDYLFFKKCKRFSVKKSLMLHKLNKPLTSPSVLKYSVLLLKCDFWELFTTFSLVFYWTNTPKTYLTVHYCCSASSDNKYIWNIWFNNMCHETSDKLLYPN